MPDEHYDLIVIGKGPVGVSLTQLQGLRRGAVDNLCLADASVASICAMNPTLTSIANAFRVADIIGERLG